MVQKNESLFVGYLERIINDLLSGADPLFNSCVVKRGVKLEYQSGFDDASEYQTDLCIFEGKTPRVVFELKTSPTTHDVMVYSQKADDHKRISPELIYGMIAEKGDVVSTKLWKHNRHMDFALALGDDLSELEITKAMTDLIKSCLEESRLREQIASGKKFRGLCCKTTVLEL